MTLYTIKERRGTASDWALANTVLKEGQWGIETNTGKAKLGNGVAAWNDLPYYVHEETVASMIAAAIAQSYVLLDADQDETDVPVDTIVGALVVRKSV